MSGSVGNVSISRWVLTGREYWDRTGVRLGGCSLDSTSLVNCSRLVKAISINYTALTEENFN